MYYQDIPFLICSEDKGIASRIGRMLSRKHNTVFEQPTEKAVTEFLQKIGYFTCQIFHYTNEEPELEAIVSKTLKMRPFSANYLLAFESVPEEVYKKYIRLGITDLLVIDNDHDEEEFRRNLLYTLNLKWRSFRFFERERNKMFHATVVTIFHEINQSLMVISNAIDLFKFALKQNEPDLVKIEQAFNFIMKSTNKIQEVLAALKDIEQPRLKNYTSEVKMIDLDSSIYRKKPS